MTVYESDIPGVGRKFELELGAGDRVVVLVHNDGRREVFYRADPDADSDRLLDLTGPQARKLGAILEGAYFQPVEVQRPEVPIGEAVIEWVEVDAASPLAERTLAESAVRRRTGASVIAIQRGEETIENPPPDTAVEAGDVLVVLATREEQAALRDLIDDAA